MRHKVHLRCAFAMAIAPFALSAAALNVTLTTNPPSPRPVGTSIILTASVSGDSDPSPSYLYAYTIAPPGAPPQVRRGFARSPQWTWTPSAYEGTFTITAYVKNAHTGDLGTATIPFTLTSRLTSDAGAVNRTNNPLVAFFSAPACRTPNQMRIRYTPLSVPPGGISGPKTTNFIPCRFDVNSSTPIATSMNFYVAGMYPNTAYNMHWEVISPTGSVVNAGPDLQFTTGPIAPGVFLPTYSSVGTASASEPILLYSNVTIPVNGHVFSPSATDTAGNVLWYSTNVPPIRTEFGGNYWGFIPGTDDYVQGIREVDLAGNSVVETTVGAINDQLAAMGKQKITSFHHEVRRIYTGSSAPPNGYILALGSIVRTSTSAQGGTPTNPRAILGDMILVLDSNLQVVWTWNAFDHLDINQRAVLNEVCGNPPAGGCPPFDPSFSVANDWLHSNSLDYTPYDGNIIISMRHQDVALKVNYGNGRGDGHIVWKFGNGPIQGVGGAPLPTIQVFTNNTHGGHDLGYPWFSHQHDVEVEFGGATIGGARVVTVFDNGNTRQATFDPNARSRCQVFALFEDSLVANLNRNVDLGSYSFAIGSAQLLSNGNTVCDSGFIGGFASANTNPKTETTESNSSGVVIQTSTAAQTSYRTFRMKDLYTPVNP